MELIWVLWFLFGLFTGVIIGDMLDEREHDNDNDMRVYVPSRDRNRSGYHGCDQFFDAEEVVNGLQTVRMALSQREKEYLDYACESVLIRHILMERAKKMKMKEGSRQDDNDD